MSPTNWLPGRSSNTRHIFIHRPRSVYAPRLPFCILTAFYQGDALPLTTFGGPRTFATPPEVTWYWRNASSLVQERPQTRNKRKLNKPAPKHHINSPSQCNQSVAQCRQWKDRQLQRYFSLHETFPVIYLSRNSPSSTFTSIHRTAFTSNTKLK